MKDLGDNCREDIYIDQHAIPYLDLTQGVSGGLDSYVLDFYRHGQLKALERDNDIRPGASWQALKSFSLVLASLATSLEARFDEIIQVKVAEEGEDAPSAKAAVAEDPSIGRERDVVTVFKVLQERFSEKFKAI